jgi:hypothetical protein
METKFFRSKLAETRKEIWSETIKDLGVNVYDVLVPAELYVILGGDWENPTAFHDKNTIVFYRRENEEPRKKRAEFYQDKYRTVWERFETHKNNIQMNILKLYYDKIIDLTGLSAKKSATLIRKTIEAHKP